MTFLNLSLGQDDTPKYRALADGIAAEIRSGGLKAGERLPTHRELAHQFGVTVGTVTRAYGELARRNLVTGEIGRGTFVRSRGGYRRVWGRCLSKAPTIRSTSP